MECKFANSSCSSRKEKTTGFSVGLVTKIRPLLAGRQQQIVHEVDEWAKSIFICANHNPGCETERKIYILAKAQGVLCPVFALHIFMADYNSAQNVMCDPSVNAQNRET